MEYLYIFDYSTNTINCIKINPDDDAIEILQQNNFKEDVCAWMVSETELEINNIN